MLINKKQKIKSLKDDHFSKFLNNFNTSPYYNFISNKNIKIINQTKLFDINSKKNIEENKKDIFLRKRKFKSPKFINYHYRFKSPPLKHLKLDKETNTNIIFNFFKKKSSSTVFKNRISNNIYELNYDPNKISFNFIHFNTDKKYLKESKKKNTNLDINDYREKNKKNKINYKYNIRKGYFGRKENMGIPYVFDTFTIFYNNYSNKSEKSRHEIILNDLQKLKGFIKGNPKNKISIFKDFLKKYNINNFEKFTNDKILSICDILCNNNIDFLTHFLKPYLNIRDMLIDLINNLLLINNKENIHLKEKISSKIFNNINDENLLIKTKIDNKNEINKESRNYSSGIKDEINNTNEFYSKTENSFYNKNKIKFYQSPFLPHKSHHHILSTKNKILTKKRILDLSDTNSLLKNINYQTKALGPRKEYSLNNDLLINDISKEMNELKNNYYKILTFNNNDNLKKKIIKENNLFKNPKNKILSHSSTLMHCTNKYSQFYTKDIFSKTSIQFYPKKNIAQKNKINLYLISLKNDILKKSNSNSEPSYKKKIEKKEKSLNEINIRLYYRPIKYKFGYKQIKDQYKIPEMAALNFAKKKKFDPMGLICKF